ncbi:hypothetical protein OY671_008541 [Metschnikowia pulcherrima]|nr:hypothetical protein OY671_008541 [Metschnikowia pulcherrima]
MADETNVSSAARTLLGAVALQPLALQLAGAANSGRLFAGALFGGLFVVAAQRHFAIQALTSQLLLGRAKSRVDIVVANENSHKPTHLKQLQARARQSCGGHRDSGNTNGAESMSDRRQPAAR